MKIKPEIYSKFLLSSINEGTSPKEIAKSFWYFLQKNGQGKDLTKIIGCLDEEFVKDNNMVLAEVVSARKLDDEEIGLINRTLEQRYKQGVLIKNIVKKDQIAGICVRVDGVEIDYSIGGRLERFKKCLKSS